MKYGVAIFVVVLCALVASSCTSMGKSGTGGPEAGDDAPLLLSGDSGEGEEEGADNSRCFVCHLNYMAEDIAVEHAKAGIGCQGCHGESSPHIADESWAEGGNGTPPDRMYTKDQIVPACMACHPKEKIDTDDHKPMFAAGSTLVCTDCHGNHRLEARKLKWK